MFRKRYFSPALAGLFLAGCLTFTANAAVFVRIAPPRPVVERVAVRPAAGFVWVGGYYRWSGRAYVWVPGSWVRPPRPAAVWIAPHWDYSAVRRGYVFVPGYWR